MPELYSVGASLPQKEGVAKARPGTQQIQNYFLLYGCLKI